MNDTKIDVVIDDAIKEYQEVYAKLSKKKIKNLKTWDWEHDFKKYLVEYIRIADRGFNF
jgi:hypothetical protein